MHCSDGDDWQVLPEFLQYCPSPITFGGMLQMTKAYLPVDEARHIHTYLTYSHITHQSWKGYLASSRAKYDECQQDIHRTLDTMVAEAWPKVSNLQSTINNQRCSYATRSTMRRGNPTPT